MSQTTARGNGTLCWDCQNACGGCSWSQKQMVPVEGWGATATSSGSYMVLRCPLFLQDEPRICASELQTIKCNAVSRNDKVKTLFRGGMTDVEIGQMIGLSAGGVAKIRYDLGLVRKRKGVVVRVSDKDGKLICAGSFGACAEKLGVKEHTLRSMYRMGVKKYRIEVVV